MSQPPIRILQLIDGLNVGGAEVLLRDLSASLVQRGYSVKVGYSSPGPLESDFARLNIPTRRLPRLGRVDPLLLLRMVGLIREYQPDIVHTHLFKSDLHGRIAARLCRVPVIVSTLHNSDSWAPRWPLGFIYGLTARLAHALIAVSEDVATYHQKFSRIDPEKIVVIHNGIPLERFNVSPTAGKAVREELGIAPDAPLVGIIGRLTVQKDQATFLQAAAYIARQLPGARFVIVGDGSLRSSLEAQAGELGLANAAIFTGIRPDIPAVLSALDILAFSSRWEGLPVTLLEGMAAARPVVATAVDGICSVAVPGQTALLAQPGDASALAEACLALFKDPAARSRMGKAGLERVRNLYSLDSMINQTVALYQALLARAGQLQGVLE